MSRQSAVARSPRLGRLGLVGSPACALRAGAPPECIEEESKTCGEAVERAAEGGAPGREGAARSSMDGAVWVRADADGWFPPLRVPCSYHELYMKAKVRVPGRVPAPSCAAVLTSLRLAG